MLLAGTAGLLAGAWAPVALAPAAALVAVLAGRAVPATLAVLAMLAGAAGAAARVEAIDHGRAPAPLGARVAVTGALLEPPRARASGERVARMRLTAGPARGEVVLVRMRSGAAAAVGAILAVRGRVVGLRPSDEFQRRRGAIAAIAAHEVVPTGGRRGGVEGVLDRVRVRAERGLDRALGPREAALLRGMVLGEDDLIEDDVRDDFQVSGLAHLLAVSGTNVMLLAVLVLAAGAAVGLPLRVRLVVALVAVAAYVPLTGAGPSIQRAGIMGAAGLVAALAGRPASRWYALGLAAAITLAANPYSAAEPGWQLSFAAVAGLVALAPPLRAALVRRRLPGPLAEAAALTVAATVATAPLLAHHFDRVSLVSLPANLVATPVVAPLMWLGMLAIAGAQLAPALAALLNAANAYLLGFLGWLAHAAASVPLASVEVGLRGTAGVVVAYAALAAVLAIGWAFRRAGGGGRALAPAVGAVALLLAIVLLSRGGGQAQPMRPGETVVSFLDVGQGDATLIQRDGAAVLFDTGPPGGPILERLAHAGVRRLDALVLTHAQLDHEGAAVPVLRRLEPRLVLNGGAGWRTATQHRLPEATKAARVVEPVAGDSLTIGPLEIRILWPPASIAHAPPSGDPNDAAVVAHVSSGGFDLLLPADAESPVTAGLELSPVEALKVAHHGSADAGLPALLARLQPAVAAIEVGRGNPYGHPAPSTLSALRSVRSVLRTDRDGTVRLRAWRGSLTIERAGGGLR